VLKYVSITKLISCLASAADIAVAQLVEISDIAEFLIQAKQLLLRLFLFLRIEFKSEQFLISFFCVVALAPLSFPAD